MSFRVAIGFILGLVAAYALSFGLDLLVASALGCYPSEPYGPGLFWASLGIVFHAGARAARASKYTIVIPYSFFGGLAMLAGIFGPHRFNLLVGTPLLLIAALQGGQLVGSRSTDRARLFPIGPYHLDSPIAGIKGLREFSPQEYALMPKEFQGGANYNLPPVSFLGHAWMMSIGTVNGYIYKLAPYLELKSKSEANKVAAATLQFCLEKLGKPAEQKTGLFIWDTSSGNVVLQTAEVTDGFGVNLFITSKSVMSFKRH